MANINLPTPPNLAWPSRAQDARDGSAGVPRWVKIFVFTTLALVLLVVVVMLLSGGQHGPDRHFSSLGVDGRSAQVTATNLLSAEGTSVRVGVNVPAA